MATNQEQELSLFELASAKLSDAQKLMEVANAKLSDSQTLMAEARDLLKQDLNNARQEKSAIEEIIKTLNELHFEIRMQTHSNCTEKKRLQFSHLMKLV